MDSNKFLMMVISFIGTVGLSIFLIRKAKIERRIYWIVGCSIGAIVWLGIVKGLIATLVSIAFTSGYISRRMDARRIGKRVADSMGIGHNLFFSALEQTLPLYLTMLAVLEREGNGVPHARQLLLPYLLKGLDALEERFGHQHPIDVARKSAEPFLSEFTESSVQQ